MGGRVIIPTFAQSRLQSLALMVYQLYKDSEWKPKVYVDTPLGIKIFKDYLIAVGIMIALWLLSCLIKYGISVSSFPDWFKFALLK